MFGLDGKMLIKVSHPLLLPKRHTENEEKAASLMDDAERLRVKENTFQVNSAIREKNNIQKQKCILYRTF